ncbi:MAG: hypothetical protein AAGA28_17565 [Pseudomonadota bacterium]
MKGLLLLAPVLSCLLALIVFLAGGDLWMILVAFFIGGPLLLLAIGSLLNRRPDKDGN